MAISPPCEFSVVCAASGTQTPHPAATLAACILGSSVAIGHSAVVAIALPAIHGELAGGPASVSWIVTAYLLPLAALTLVGGSTADRFGRKRTFLFGLSLFSLASVACAMAPDLAWLLAGRIAQGIGAAFLLPGSLALLGASFRGKARGSAVGSWAAACAIMGVLAPLAGGWIVDALSWRWVFLINLPLAWASGCLVHWYVAEGAGHKGASLDWGGALLVVLGLLAVAAALTGPAVGMGPKAGTVSGCAGLALLAVFVRLEHRRSGNAIVELSWFRNPGFSGVTLMTFFLYASLTGLSTLLPYFLISVADFSATEAAAAILPLPLMTSISSRWMGRLASRHGPRWLLGGGAILVASGLLLLAQTGDTVVYWTDIFPATMTVALGVGISAAPLTEAVMSSVDAEDVGSANGLNNAVARIAGVVSTALLGAVFSAQGSAGEFLAAFRNAALIGSGSATIAAVSVLVLMRSRSPAVAMGSGGG